MTIKTQSYNNIIWYFPGQMHITFVRLCLSPANPFSCKFNQWIFSRPYLMLSWVKTGNKSALWGHPSIWQHLFIYSTLIFTLIRYLLRAQERHATLILTVTSGLRLTRARYVHNRDTETGNWNFVLQLRTIRMWKMCQSQQFVTWDPSFCHPGSNFRGKKIKNPAIVENVIFFH